MRKRSGALHSDSSEEFMLLAEYAHEKNGYFYDESLHKEVRNRLRTKFKRVSSKNEAVSPHNFQGFDYAAQDEELVEENQELWAQSHTLQINLVLLCQNPTLIRSKLEQIWPTTCPPPPTAERRQLDLFVHTLKHESQHVHCYKFWILDVEQSGNPIYASYLNRAKRIFKIGNGGKDCIPEHEVKGVLFSCVSSLMD